MNDPPQLSLRRGRIDLGGGWWTQPPEALAELTRRHDDFSTVHGRKRKGWRWRSSLVINTELYRSGRRK